MLACERGGAQLPPHAKAWRHASVHGARGRRGGRTFVPTCSQLQVAVLLPVPALVFAGVDLRALNPVASCGGRLAARGGFCGGLVVSHPRHGARRQPAACKRLRRQGLSLEGAAGCGAPRRPVRRACRCLKRRAPQPPQLPQRAAARSCCAPNPGGHDAGFESKLSFRRASREFYLRFEDTFVDRSVARTPISEWDQTQRSLPQALAHAAPCA